MLYGLVLPSCGQGEYCTWVGRASALLGGIQEGSDGARAMPGPKRLHLWTWGHFLEFSVSAYGSPSGGVDLP